MKYIKEYYSEGIEDVSKELIDNFLLIRRIDNHIFSDKFLKNKNSLDNKEILIIYDIIEKNNLNHRDISNIYKKETCIKIIGSNYNFIYVDITKDNDDYYYLTSHGKAYRCDQFSNLKKLIKKIIKENYNKSEDINESLNISNGVEDITNEFKLKEYIEEYGYGFNAKNIEKNFQKIERTLIEKVDNFLESLKNKIEDYNIGCNKYIISIYIIEEGINIDICCDSDDYYYLYYRGNVYKCDQFNNVKKQIVKIIDYKKDFYDNKLSEISDLVKKLRNKIGKY